MWIGTETDGLLCLKETDSSTWPFSHPPEVSALKGGSGRQSLGWHDGGRIEPLAARTVDVITTNSGLPFASVHRFCQDTEGWMWRALPKMGRCYVGAGINGVRYAAMGLVWWQRQRALLQPVTRRLGRHPGQGLRGCREARLRKGLSDGLGSQNVRSLLQATNGCLWSGRKAPVACSGSRTAISGAENTPRCAFNCVWLRMFRGIIWPGLQTDMFCGWMNQHRE